MILEDRESSTVYIPIEGDLLRLPEFMDWSEPIQFRIEHKSQPSKGASRVLVFRKMVHVGKINNDDVYRKSVV